MGRFKQFVTSGVHVSRTRREYQAWSWKMLREFGPSVKPHIIDIRKWSVLGRRWEPDVKLNCWEFMGCGGEGGGCPVLGARALNGVHGGRNAGRVCWIVAGTRCGGSQQGSAEDKQGLCASCDFYRMVLEEEGRRFKRSHLLERKKKKP